MESLLVDINRRSLRFDYFPTQLQLQSQTNGLFSLFRLEFVCFIFHQFSVANEML